MVWETYPADYREREVQQVLQAIQAGECAAVIGLSGAGKSNLMGYLAHRVAWDGRFVLVDGNRLVTPAPEAFFRLVRRALGEGDPTGEGAPATDEFLALSAALDRALAVAPGRIALLLDRFDALDPAQVPQIASNLRSLRDAYKYRLTFVTATRRPLDPHTELAELVYAHTFWLGPLSPRDVAWNVRSYAARKGLDWGPQVVEKMGTLSRGYPALLRAVSEAYALGCPLELEALRQHPAVVRRVREFWADEPDNEMVRRSGLTGHPLLQAARSPHFDTSQLTAKEQRLLDYFQGHPGEVCEKDAIIRAVWPEDRIYQEGVRDDSLSQLVRRLRVKIEPDPADPQYIQTVPGRGYLFERP